ncbi:zinc finger SWIM domain-containing protein 7-like isoform X2 [Cimex lectularius]|uniref:SWIM-type domain-containing protein n=1 Tax=Cimex lectularius TaxID=79782 RepID=A0A8I6S3W8_CIMLE|nr:zinc finger SWIM domain-containing protein 7-like isoform X2 [Cimex lectularius]XP_014255323.1 zinc finger SWIM domain-containing protein 7-like isoform X2 [Cimex lectularius]XP_014255324.1 zinc finger SWIM domain-containing protein 7-like isoform X2 [Cimex lectularius]
MIGNIGVDLTSSNVELAFLCKSSLHVICNQIRENNSTAQEDVNLLYTLFGDILFKALELLDKDSIELITITNSQRKYFLVEDQGFYYTLYKHIPFCKCDQFRKSVDDNKVKNICSHVLACELSLALCSYHCTSMDKFVVQPLSDMEDEF